MAQDNSNSTMEMGTSDQVLVAAKRKKRLTYAIGIGAMAVIVAVVVILAVVLSGNDAGTPEPIISTTDESTISTTDEPTTLSTEESSISTIGVPSTPPTITIPETTSESSLTPTESTTEVIETTTQGVSVPVLDLDDIIGDKYIPSSFDATWSSGSDLVMRDENGDLILYRADTNSSTILVKNTSEILQQSSRAVLLSSEGDEVVLSYNVAPLYRHSFLAQYAAINVDSQNVIDILPPGITKNSDAFLQNFVWSPIGTALAFVYQNNIFYKSNLTNEPQQITNDGQVNVIYHGIPDWVYEEEVFSSNNAMWFSANGKKLAYATFDDSQVRIMKVPHYGAPGSVFYQYTQHHEIRYPKPGTVNPKVKVTIQDLTTNTSTVFDAPEDLNEPILKPVKFVSNDTIALMWTDRAQTKLVVDLCTHNSKCVRIYEYNETNGWIDNIPLIFSDQGSSFITILPEAVDGVRYKQVVQVSEESGRLWTSRNRVNRALTVTDILRWTSDDVIWYKASEVNGSADQHIYTVSATGVISCFTCDIGGPDECQYNDADISSDGRQIVINCLGPNIPRIYIYNTTGEVITTWADNSQLSSVLEEIEMPVTIRLSVPIAAGLPEAVVQIQAPPDYENLTNVPLLVNVYGGPDTALATKEWVLDWGTSLVNRYKIAVARIDGRGSGLLGVENMFAVNRHLGSVEIEDQINVTRKLHDLLPWLDKNRTCIWGWSYGGYASSLALARGDGVFRCAMAVAPVVDWRFYDTIYTERYMDTPANNPKGYVESSLLTDQVVESFRDKSYFLIHGTADDNVHYQHAMLISRLLQRRDVYFTQMSYTDEDHGLIGVRPHLYHALEKFLQENDMFKRK